MRHHYFSSEPSSTWMPLSLISYSLKIESRNKFGIYTGNHSWAVTSHFLSARRTPQYCISSPQSFPPIELRSHPSFMCWSDWYDHHHECPTYHTVTLAIIFWQVVLSWGYGNPPLSIGGEFQRGKHISPTKTKVRCELLCRNMFTMSLPLLNLSHYGYQNDRFLRHLLHVSPDRSATSYRKIQFSDGVDF
jgi:hypothetical protein